MLRSTSSVIFSSGLQRTPCSSNPPSTPPGPEMLPRLRRVLLRPALSLRAAAGLASAGLGNHQAAAGAAAAASTARLSADPLLVQRCHLGTHPLKEPMEPLNSPRGAKEFIYSLHPSERTCLLRELHRFESIAIAQGGSTGRKSDGMER